VESLARWLVVKVVSARPNLRVVDGLSGLDDPELLPTLVVEEDWARSTIRRNLATTLSASGCRALAAGVVASQRPR
jgi:hypothetical protein